MKFLLLLFYSSSLCNWVRAEGAVTFDNYKILRVVPQNPQHLEMINEIETTQKCLVLLQGGNIGQPVDLAVPPHLQTDFMDNLRDQMPTEIISHNIETLINRESMQMQMESEFSTEAGFDTVFTQYLTFTKIQQFVLQLQELNPNLVKVSSYGKSFEGRDLIQVAVQKNTGSTNKHLVLMDCGLHAREWITNMECCHWLTQLCDTSSPAHALLDNFNFLVMPSANPDGLEHSWNTFRLWRKTRNTNPTNPACVGTDPNRNWAFGHSGTGSSTDECSDVYCGPAPFSAPETLALSKVLKEQEPTLYLSMHSYSQLILMSYGCDAPGLTNKNFTEQQTIANKAVQALHDVHQTTYEAGNSKTILYEACGCSTDWALAENLCKYAYTYELRDTGRTGFLLPEDQIAPTCDETSASVVTMCTEILKRNPL
ncbi:Zinc carboxypeptidase A 1 [Orchesella cincta]|uniref:Zinc carboxypeptidase A 1 n=1 Tax=Orchesella cincta TaxID=48709 RepID=A0A1D2N7I4_ORCCI|nr:Zinc carboxypeptidase A 1 [Orchesella cincta]